ncbi:MAG: DUF721 domain-containing protein [Verrucomicrobiae bacterium]|nr:DUF721 domain-containing protein [Verrucomicrobiae bacterium]
MGGTSKFKQGQLRAKVLGEWRGASEVRKTNVFEHPITDLLPGIMRRIGVQDQITAEAITAEWRGIVGEFLASNSRPLKLQNRVLTIAVLQSTLLYMLEQEFKREILAKVRERFGDKTVRDVKFTVG